ncbi:hypothetical protein L0V05_08320 [Tabrizicola sp. J26]|nr:hypothetical protein [Tabrizicola rongguiensis]MCF1708817.1 hypothetical protein [Tabrizicola rongguiensis]
MKILIASSIAMFIFAAGSLPSQAAALSGVGLQPTVMESGKTSGEPA